MAQFHFNRYGESVLCCTWSGLGEEPQSTAAKGDVNMTWDSRGPEKPRALARCESSCDSSPGLPVLQGLTWAGRQAHMDVDQWTQRMMRVIKYSVLKETRQADCGPMMRRRSRHAGLTASPHPRRRSHMAGSLMQSLRQGSGTRTALRRNAVESRGAGRGKGT